MLAYLRPRDRGGAVFARNAAWISLTLAPCVVCRPPAVAPYRRPQLQDIFTIDKSKLLGAGSAAYVVRAVHKVSGDLVAVKRIRRGMTSYALKDVRSEIACLRALRGQPHIVQLIDDFDDDDETASLVFGLAAHGDLHSYVSAHGPLSEAAAKHVLHQLVNAVAACHAAGIVHRDIKLENVLVTAIDPTEPWKLTVQLADFGFAVSARHPLTRQCGTEGYMAPEMCAKQSYDTSVDIWSLGVVAYCLLQHALPYDGVTFVPAPSMNGLSSEAKSFLLSMLQVDPRQRTAAKDLCSHEWFVDRVSLARFVQQLLSFLATHQPLLTTEPARDRAKTSLEGLDWIATCLSSRRVDMSALSHVVAYVSTTLGELKHDLPFLHGQVSSFVTSFEGIRVVC
ncbi:Protein kinase domain containing protein [Achlya hypogyna]|uniref:Protein kinase domain containing protein n=1 Tax=Achlya hypogyna TaxID=1202772 RepID=A0A1V9ZJ06_ACHHY|nr:Protein kinase domain containing protein [Achlya hypogyna]